jgi:hypothetical protein
MNSKTSSSIAARVLSRSEFLIMVIQNPGGPHVIRDTDCVIIMVGDVTIFHSSRHDFEWESTRL